MAKKSVASKKKQSKVKIAKKVTSTKGKRRNAIKSLDVLLSDDEYIKILIKENGLNKIKKEDLHHIIELRKIKLVNKNMLKKEELVKFIKGMFKH